MESEQEVTASEILSAEGREDPISDFVDSGVSLRQKGQIGSIARVLQNGLGALDEMPKEKRRDSQFLKQLLVDLQRPAPHLRQPAIREKQLRFVALLSAFEDMPEGVDEDERAWCVWQDGGCLRHSWKVKSKIRSYNQMHMLEMQQ